MSNPSLTNRRIIVIDDNTAIHDDFRKILTNNQGPTGLDDEEAFLFAENEPAFCEQADTYEVDSASQGRQGLELVRIAAAEGRPYAVAFVDMRMPPGWDGVETIQHLWEADPELLVVVCTAYSDYSWQEMIDRLGQSDRLLILKKPFDVVEVVQIAAALTRKWDARRELRDTIREMAGRIERRTREAEEARCETNRLLGAIPSLLIEVDRDFVITRWNRRATDLLGPTADEARGQRLDDLQISWVKGSVEDLLMTGLQGSETARVEACVRDAQGELRTLTFSAQSAGDNQGVLLVGTEVTGTEQLSGDRFAGIDDLHAPLQSVCECLHCLQSSFEGALPALEVCRELLGPERDAPQVVERARSVRIDRLEHFIERAPEAIGDSTAQVDQICRALEAKPSASSNTSPCGRAPVDLNDMLHTIFRVLQEKPQDTVTFETDLDPNLPLVPVFLGELNQVLLDLFISGEDAIVSRLGVNGGSTGRIEVSTRQQGEEIELRITDSTSADTECANEDPNCDAAAGAARRLAAAYPVIVQQHAGLIWFEREPGHSTTFILRLPLQPAGTQTSATEKPCSDRGHTHQVV